MDHLKGLVFELATTLGRSHFQRHLLFRYFDHGMQVLLDGRARQFRRNRQHIVQ